jgi:hypothetical protein
VRALLVFAIILAARPAWADLPPGQWRTARPIVLPPETRPGLVYLPLDADALSVHSLDEYRVVQAGRTEIPYRALVEDGRLDTCGVASKVVRWTEVPSRTPSAIEITLDLGSGGPSANAVTLHLSGENFQVKARVLETRSPDKPGVLLAEDAVYRRGGGFAKDTVVFRPSSERYLRVSLAKDQGSLPRVEGIDVLRRLKIPQRLVLAPTKLARTEEAERRCTILDLDPGKLTRDVAVAELEARDPLFDRYAQVFVALEAPRPGEATEYSLAREAHLRRSRPGERVVLPLGLEQARYLRIAVHNGDDRPLEISRVILRRVRRGLMFQADPRFRCELWYGNTKARAPVYDLAKLPLTVPLQRLPCARLGPARHLRTAPPPPPPWSERHLALFWVALFGLVSILLLVIIQAMRKTKAPTEET